MTLHEEDLPSLSGERLALVGIQEIAYLRRAEIDGAVVYEIHAADGGYICRVPDAPTGHALLRKNGMEPLSLH